MRYRDLSPGLKGNRVVRPLGNRVDRLSKSSGLECVVHTYATTLGVDESCMNNFTSAHLLYRGRLQQEQGLANINYNLKYLERKLKTTGIREVDIG